MLGPEHQQYIKAMKREIDQLEKKEVWDLIPRSEVRNQPDNYPHLGV